MKNPITSAGIEPAAFRFLAQHLNHCATAVPTERVMSVKNSNDAIGNRTRDLPTCTAVTQPTGPQRGTLVIVGKIKETVHILG